MNKNKKSAIAIIGGGLAGIATAYQLKNKGYKDITIYESNEVLSGLVLTHKTSDNIEIENFYHHIFTSDKYILEMIKKFSINKRLKFKKAITSHLINNRIYTLGSIKSLILTSLFNPLDKIRFIFALAFIKFLPISRYLFSNKSAVNFSRQFFGNSIHQAIWLPLLKKKFSTSYNLVPSSWLISRIKCRSSKLGYLIGSFSLLINKFVENISKSGIKIKLNSEINSVSIIENNKVKLTLSSKSDIKDIVIFCCPQKVASKLLNKENKKLVADHLDYLSATCVIIYLTENPFDDYWINYCDKDTEALAVINHSVFLNSGNISNYPVYIAYYHDQNDTLYLKENRKLLIEDGIKTLKKVCNLRGKNLPYFDRDEIKVFNAKYAQPLIMPNLENNKSMQYPPQKLHPKKELPIFFSNMHCVYPEDRGQNFSIKFAKLTATKVEKYLRMKSKN